MTKEAKKIGILTFHFGYNYGGVLQCLALQNLLQEMGHYVEVVDYRPLNNKKKIAILQGWGIFSGNFSIKKTINRFKTIKHEKSTKEKFEIFREKNLNLSERCTNQDELAEIINKYNVIITGSDQVWNRSYTKDISYFLDFSKPYKGKKMSFAACSGNDELPDKNIKEIKNALKKIDYLSVRNEVTYNWIKKLIGKDSTIVCDPTLLYDFKNYLKSTIKPYNEYILMYVLQEEIDGGHKNTIKKIKKTIGDLPLVNIVLAPHHPYYCSFADLNINASIEEWVSLIANSSYVYTNSFHGVLFAMKYKKRFLAYYSSGIRSHRLLDVGSRFGVEQVIVSGLADAISKNSFEQVLNYDRINKEIENNKNKSIEFLNNSLK